MMLFLDWNSSRQLMTPLSIAPTSSRAKMGKRKRTVDADRVEDSKEVDSSDFSSDKETEAAICAKPITSRPPPELKNSHLDNYFFGFLVTYLLCALIRSARLGLQTMSHLRVKKIAIAFVCSRVKAPWNLPLSRKSNTPRM
jgi:hypothetical protein